MGLEAYRCLAARSGLLMSGKQGCVILRKKKKKKKKKTVIYIEQENSLGLSNGYK